MRSENLAGRGRVAKVATLLVIAAAAVLPTNLPAQTVNDDVRCLLLSAGYARAAKEDAARRSSTLTGSFYLGRLSGRLGEAALTAAIKAQGKGLPVAEAATAMRACAARAATAEQRMTETIKGAQGGQ